jgi:hypothetical protein
VDLLVVAARHSTRASKLSKSCWNKPTAKERAAMDDALRAQRLGLAHLDASRGAEAETARKVLAKLDAEVLQLRLSYCWTRGCTGCSRSQ